MLPLTAACELRARGQPTNLNGYGLHVLRLSQDATCLCGRRLCCNGQITCTSVLRFRSDIPVGIPFLPFRSGEIGRGVLGTATPWYEYREENDGDEVGMHHASGGAKSLQAQS